MPVFQRLSIRRMCGIAVFVAACAAGTAHAGEPAQQTATPIFKVRVDESVVNEPVSGRLLVFMAAESASIPPNSEPGDAPFYHEPQPLFAIEVRELKPGSEAILTVNAAAFPKRYEVLAQGRYRVQAVLDRSRVNSLWRSETGNLYSEVSVVTVSGMPQSPAELTLTKIVPEDSWTPGAGIEVFRAPSKLLTEFRSTPVEMRAAVIFPTDYEPSRRYPAVYYVPGFSTDHRFARQLSMMRSAPQSGLRELSANAFLIVLDPESGNGHTLFADSANNGPVGRALVEEFIPAMEAKYPLISKAGARAVMGHSSGGWSSVWLTIRYPEVFGSCFSGAPDPLDFQAFQRVDIYSSHWFYRGSDGTDVASYTVNGSMIASVRDENSWEEVRGPRNSSGEQWDSWLAVFGPRAPDGLPADLFDPRTGAMNPEVAEHFRAYDVAHLVRSDPERYVPLFRDRVRIVAAGDDQWNLDEAVERLGATLRERGAAMDGVESWGAIIVVPATNHTSVTRTRPYVDQHRALLERFRAAGHLPEAVRP